VHRVRRVVLPVLAALAVAGAACGPGSGRAPTSAPQPSLPVAGAPLVPVTSVVDGDTIHVTFDGRDERVRFIGIDTPEVAHGGRPAECFGDRAADETRRRLGGRSVRLDFDVDRRDRFGRLLAYVSDAEGLVNLALVRDGYAIVLTVPPDTRMADEFERAEADARAAGRGLWSACPTPGS
jgi:micrococcal nuclease